MEAGGYSFGSRSRAFLLTCHSDLIQLGEEAIRTSPFDFSCTEGVRSAEVQRQKVAAKLSKVTFSKHQVVPSRAVHFDPFPVQYPKPGEEPLMVTVKAYARYYMLAVHIMTTAKRLNIDVRGGFDWDGDFDIQDQTFDDLAHYELRS